MDIQKLETLVFSGGGVRGLAYIGFILAFQDNYRISVHQHFKCFVGSSVGALFALLCAINIDMQTCLEIFHSTGLSAIFSKDPTWLLTNYALNSGEVLHSVVRKVLEAKGHSENITFAELYAKTKKHLIVTVVDMLSASTLYLDHLNEGQSISVLSTIMGSMALPPLFPPVPIGQKYLFTDGGLTDNFPIAKFDLQSTLGVRTTWYIDPSNPMDDIASYYTRIFSILQLTMHSMQSNIAAEYPYNIFIDLGYLKADNVDIDIQDLVFKGYRTSILRFATANNSQNMEECPTKFLKTTKTSLPFYIDKTGKK